MRECKTCGNIKFWFQFHTKNMWLYTETYDICNKCANKIKDTAIYTLNTRDKVGIKLDDINF